MKTRVRNNTEYLQEFGAELERLVQFVYPEAPDDFSHQLCFHSDVDGVKDLQFQQALRLGRY